MYQQFYYNNCNLRTHCICVLYLSHYKQRIYYYISQLQLKVIGFYNKDHFRTPVVIVCNTSLTIKNCTLYTKCIYVFVIYLRTNSDLCHLQHNLVGFYNIDLTLSNPVFTICITSLIINNCTLEALHLCILYIPQKKQRFEQITA